MIDYEGWYERVNSGARFCLDPRDELRSPKGEPLLRLPLARRDETGYPLIELALYLYNRSVGALLTHPEDAEGATNEDADLLALSFGDVVDFLQTGVVLDRAYREPPWGIPNFQESEGIAAVEPLDYVALPHNTRRQFGWLFEQVQATDIGISLIRGTNGLQAYWVSYKTQSPLPPETVQAVADRIQWYMPRHIATIVEWDEDGVVRGYPLWPAEPEPAETEHVAATPSLAAEPPTPRFKGDARTALLQLFAETVERQFAEIERSERFPRARIPIGPAALLELGCFNLAFVRREFGKSPHAFPQEEEALAACADWLTTPFLPRYRAEDLTGLVQERLGHYGEEIETKWDEETDSWSILYGGLSASLWLRIAAHDSFHELRFGTPTRTNSENLDTLRAIIGMDFDLSTSCLMTTTPLVFIVRRWLESGRMFELTPTELTALATQGADGAEALLVLQAQEDDEDEGDEDDEA